MTLDVLISTIYPEGIERVARMDLPKMDGVKYIVSWQMPGTATIPSQLNREDIFIYPSETRGISVNRNLAISKSSADICLVSDDDLRYESQMLQHVMDAFESYPEIDLAMFKFEGSDNKRYADYEYDLSNPPKFFYVSEIEMAFRRSSVQGKIEFCPKISAGTDEILSGEGEMFLITAIKKGLKGRFFPKVIAIHDGESTGVRKNQPPGVVKAKGMVIYMKHQRFWLPHIIVNALREHKHGRCRVDKALVYLCQGAMFARRNFNPDGTCR